MTAPSQVINDNSTPASHRTLPDQFNPKAIWQKTTAGFKNKFSFYFINYSK